MSTRVEKYRRKRRTKRRFLSVFVGFIGFACKKRRFLTVLSVFVGFVDIVGFACKKRRFSTVFVGFVDIVGFACKKRRFSTVFVGFVETQVTQLRRNFLRLIRCRRKLTKLFTAPYKAVISFRRHRIQLM